MSTEKTAGVIYILTNPSFPDYVKIGYATNLEKRLAQLNRSECIPYAFRVYATYEVSKPLQNKELHSLIDRLNPDLRAIDTFNGKTRAKEFYAMARRMLMSFWRASLSSAAPRTNSAAGRRRGMSSRTSRWRTPSRRRQRSAGRPYPSSNAAFPWALR